MFAMTTVRRMSIRSATAIGTAVLALLFLPCHSLVAESVESKENIGAFKDPKGPIVAERTNNNIFEISRCEARESSDTQSFSYSTGLEALLKRLKGSTPLNSTFEISAVDTETTISRFQNTKHFHYDIVQITESPSATGFMKVDLKIFGYWRDGATRSHAPDEGSTTLKPCNWSNLGWQFCREDRIEQIWQILLAVDKLHK
jgi:hypothetical protein